MAESRPKNGPKDARHRSVPLLPFHIVVQVTSFRGGPYLRRLSLVLPCAFIVLAFSRSIDLSKHKDHTTRSRGPALTVRPR
jgi:hypothetical protein